MASIGKVATGWRARWRTPDGRSRSKTFKRKADAERHLTSVEHSKLTGGYIDPRLGKVTFRAYCEQWRTVQIHRPATTASLASNLKNHVYPHLGDRPIGTIRAVELQALLKGLSDTLEPTTVRLVWRWVTTIFKAAVTDQVIPRSPCTGIKLPSQPREKVTPLTTETVEALIDTFAEPYRAIVVLGVGTGVRIGEALALTVERVNFMRREVTIDRQLARIAPIEFGPIKNNHPRVVPLPEVVLHTLNAHLNRFGEGPQRLLFTAPDGRPLTRRTFAKSWRSVAGPLGIPVGDGFHQLRHYYASLLIRHGLDVVTVAERLGDTPAEVLKTYAHLWPGSEDRTRAAVDSVLGARVSNRCQAPALEK